MSSVFLYFPGDRLSQAELTAACLDGHLVELGEGYVPADTVETAALRAASLRSIAGTELAAVLESAAWIHGIRDRAPGRHRLQRATAHRLHEPIGRRFHYRDPRVPAQDLQVIGGIAVTSPARTVADLARSGSPESLQTLRAYAVRDADAVAAGIRWVREAGRIPYKRAALRVLEELVRTR